MRKLSKGIFTEAEIENNIGQFEGLGRLPHFAALGTRLERQKAITVLAMMKEIRVDLIARFTNTSRTSCYRYSQRFRLGGIGNLYPTANRSNGATKAENDDNKAAVFSLLHEPPSIHGFNRTTWRIEDLKSMLGEKGISVGIHNIRRIIRSAGYRWRKARKVLTSRDPQYRGKLGHMQKILSSLQSNEAFFSVDEYGPFAVKIQGGRSYAPPGQPRTVPQWQRSKGCLMMMAALELSSNQITHFYTDKKNTDVVIKIVDILRCKYEGHRKIYISWDAASWHMSKRLRNHIDAKNEDSECEGYPFIELAPLPAGAQFLNVIESVFSGMARAIIHNSDYPDVDTVKKAIDRHFAERNKFFKDNPKRAGNKVWGKERSQSSFSPSNNCKDPLYR